MAYSLKRVFLFGFVKRLHKSSEERKENGFIAGCGKDSFVRPSICCMKYSEQSARSCSKTWLVAKKVVCFVARMQRSRVEGIKNRKIYAIDIFSFLL